jgi:hypothetical protein
MPLDTQRLMLEDFIQAGLEMDQESIEARKS